MSTIFFTSLVVFYHSMRIGYTPLLHISSIHYFFYDVYLMMYVYDMHHDFSHDIWNQGFSNH